MHIHASLQKHMLRTPRPNAFTYIQYHMCIYIYKYLKDSVAIYCICTSMPPCRNICLEPLGPIPLHI